MIHKILHRMAILKLRKLENVIVSALRDEKISNAAVCHFKNGFQVFGCKLIRRHRSSPLALNRILDSQISYFEKAM